MIKIDFALVAAVILIFILMIVIRHWISYNYSHASGFIKNLKHLKQCPVCTGIFFYYDRPLGIIVCPKCKSYINDEYPKE